MLAALAQRIIDDHKTNPPREIGFGDRDLYLAIGSNDLFDIYAIDTHTPVVGSLQDDLAELRKLLDDPQRIATPVDMERLGNMLRAVSQVVT